LISAYFLSMVKAFIKNFISQILILPSPKMVY
jgi:hypothetical protein